MILPIAATVFVFSVLTFRIANAYNYPYPWNNERLDRVEAVAGLTALGSGILGVVAAIWKYLV